MRLNFGRFPRLFPEYRKVFARELSGDPGTRTGHWRFNPILIKSHFDEFFFSAQLSTAWPFQSKLLNQPQNEQRV
jgi:hypothetical protein